MKFHITISHSISLTYVQAILVFYVNLLWLQAYASTNETDRLALLKFRQGINSDPFGVLNSWNDSIPFCNWLGIRCGHRHQSVTSLKLDGHNLHGTISPYIGNLSFLRNIYLPCNSFHGEIPQEVGNLFRLQYFVLDNNTIEGEIPLGLTNCSQLKIISLGYNKVVGTIPVELCSLARLENLFFSMNNMTGEIPPCVGNLSALNHFSVAFNNLVGNIPEDIGRLSSLTFFSVAINKLSGTIPASLYNISAINVISTPQNQLHGTLPNNIGITVPNLQRFVIAENKFSGPIPKSISNASQLELFSIALNNFVGMVPRDLGKLQSLRRLNVGQNNLGSNSTNDLAFFASLTNCSNLQVLDISSNGLGGTLPNSIANLSTQLTELYVDDNQIFGTIPAALDNLVNLILLDMSINRLTGSIPPNLGNFPKLQALVLHKNRLSGQIPSSLGNLTQLAGLALFQNNLAGSIPPSIGNCKGLYQLFLSQNKLSGGIPPEILQISSLSQILDLSKNLLTGSLPEEVGKLTNLNALDISENNLSGEIPKTIGSCLNLQYLYMEENSFHGNIPSSLISLKGLLYLDLSRNNLTGPIPKDLQGIPFLYLNLSFNDLEGEVPTGGAFGNTSALFLTGNNKLCGGIPEFNLPKCLNKLMKKGKSLCFKLAITISCVVLFVISMLAILLASRMKKSKKKSTSSPLISDNLIKVSYKDLYQATSGFSSINSIGSGGFGTVYKGFLSQVQRPVAVKVLNLAKQGASKSFKAECKALRNIRHRNLVKIITSCSTIDYKRNEFKALVFELMANGNLEMWLHPSVGSNSNNLNLLQRLNIAIDVASALHYLHDLCESPIIHGDLKPSNVLLDNEMVAHLSDFGLARLFTTTNDLSQSQTSTIGIKGTIGYAAPEYGTGSAASKEGDVYSYGILVLEMFSGRRPTDEMFKDNLNLHDFVKTALPKRVFQIVDPPLLQREIADRAAEMAVAEQDNGIVEEEEAYNNGIQIQMKCLLAVLEIGLTCSEEVPKQRMNMMDVTRKLHLIKKDFFGTSNQRGRQSTI